MKRFLPRTALLFILGATALSSFAATTSPNVWDGLQPDRDQVIASLNIVELLKRHHYNKQ